VNTNYLFYALKIVHFDSAVGYLHGANVSKVPDVWERSASSLEVEIKAKSKSRITT
jgi:hypothetical protein